MESLLDQLKVIQKEKDWTCEEAGKEFASLLTKEPDPMMMGGMDYYYDEYGPEDYMNQVALASP